jgi:hypothetical protein
MTSTRPALLARAAVTATFAASFLAGCGSDDPGASPPPVADKTATTGLLAEHDLEGRTARDIIDELDRAEDKPSDLMASIRYDELLVTDTSKPDEEASLPIEEDFYLSMAPYVDQTHECFYHSLTTCQGELVEEEVDVTITSSDGEVLVDETLTTYPNGFVGFWLPRDIEATLEVSYDDRSATTEIGTGPKDPTCLTTVQLT